MKPIHTVVPTLLAIAVTAFLFFGTPAAADKRIAEQPPARHSADHARIPLQPNAPEPAPTF